MDFDVKTVPMVTTSLFQEVVLPYQITVNLPIFKPEDVFNVTLDLVFPEVNVSLSQIR